MKFSENLQKLRKEYGYSQEQLADKLGVSRQAVSKWESGNSYPEMETLIIMSELFECTIDELIQKEVSIRNKMKKNDYLEFMHQFAFSMAAGVALVLMGIISVLIMEQFLPENSDLIAVPFFMFILVAVVIFVYKGLERAEFDKRIKQEGTPKIDEQDRKKFNKKFNLATTTGVAAILFGLVMTLLTENMFPENSNMSSIVFFIFIIVAVVLFIYYGVMYDAYNPKEETEQRLKIKKRENLNEKICGIIMLLATLIFLLLGFIFNLWHPSWAVFPLGGILCAIVSVILGIDEKDN